MQPRQRQVALRLLRSRMYSNTREYEARSIGAQCFPAIVSKLSVCFAPLERGESLEIAGSINIASPWDGETQENPDSQGGGVS